ncbi:MAG: nucleoside deaminase [Anaerolineaceae bacterium]|nr:nucleoside deaminase [Anaerolineaceae bacterium]
MTFNFNSLDHAYFMSEALNEATQALQAGERPIGAVIVHNGQIIGRGQAQHKNNRNRLAHAELNALLSVANRLYEFDRGDAVIYTTVEPCEMCLGAIVMSDAVNHIVYALPDRWINTAPMFAMPHVQRHIYNYLGGVLEKDSADLWEKYSPRELSLIREGKLPE